MTVGSGTHLGPYVVREQSSSIGSGAWFDASEGGLDRLVSVLIAPLPAESGAANALRERARRLARATDARLLPVYGQGEDEHVLWLATRHVGGRSFSQLGRLDRGRAARLGSQIARQLSALEDAGVAPDDLAAVDVVVEGANESERAWLLPNPMREAADDASTATRSLARLLEDAVGAPLVDVVPAEPKALADLLTPTSSERSRRGTLVGAAAVVSLLGVAAALGFALSGDSSPSTSTPAARETARIPLGATVAALTADERSVWASTAGGELIRVDTETETVVGAPVTVFPKDAYVDLLSDGDSLWVGGPELLLRLDSTTGREIERRSLGARAVSGLALADESLWVTLNDGPSAQARLVRFEAESDREVAQGPAFGVFPVPVLAKDDSVWALGGDASLTRVAGNGSLETIGLASQAGFPVEHGGRIWVPTRIERSLVVVDPHRMTLQRSLHFDAEPIRAVAGAGSIWVLTQNPSRVYRIDPETSRFLGTEVPAPTGATFIRFGAGSLWVDDPKSGAIRRLAPSDPTPTAHPPEVVGDVVRNGPVPPKVRLQVTALEPNFSIQVRDAGWLAGGLSGTAAQFELIRARKPGLDIVGVNVAVTSHAFGRSGRLVPVRTPEDFVGALRDNPSLRVIDSAPALVGGRRGTRVRFRTTPRPPFPETCRGAACVLLFPQERGTFVLLKGTEEFTVLPHPRGVFLIDATFGEPVDSQRARQIRELVDSIRFDP